MRFGVRCVYGTVVAWTPLRTLTHPAQVIPWRDECVFYLDGAHTPDSALLCRDWFLQASRQRAAGALLPDTATAALNAETAQAAVVGASTPQVSVHAGITADETGPRLELAEQMAARPTLDRTRTNVLVLHCRPDKVRFLPQLPPTD
jgi:hypothetical protein